MAAPTATKAAIQRAISATKDAGLTPAALSVSKDGTIRIEILTDKKDSASSGSPKILQPKKWASR